MRRWKFNGGLETASKAVQWQASRGGTWTRTAKHHKAVHPCCAVCGSVVDLETDHIIPLHRGGTNEWKNLQSLCAEHHREKTAAEAGNRARQTRKI